MIITIGCEKDEVFISDITDLEGGDYIQLVYIGTSSCKFCSDSLHHEIKQLRSNLKKWAHYHDYRFISTGISLDLYAEEGVRFLRKSGPYDEMIVGGSWYNLGAHHYIWDNENTEPSTPQVMILKLKLKIAGNSSGNILEIDREEEVFETFNLLEDLQEVNNLFNPTKSHWLNKNFE